MTVGLTASLLVGLGSPALAVPEPRDVAQNSNGVGVCVSQVAIRPELFGVDRLGEAARQQAQSGSLQATLSGLRNACGGPPGPGHLR